MTKAITTNVAPAATWPRTPAMLCVATVLFAASLPAFHQQAFGTRISDIPNHFLIGTSGSYSVYSVLYLLVHGLRSIGANEEMLGWTAIILLSTCVALKGAITFRALSEKSEGPALAACVAIVLAFPMPIINWWNYQSVYMGQIAPTVWHNATTIVAMPVVILLFEASLRCLEAPSLKNTLVTAGLGVLSAMIKPSYAIAWLPVFIPWFCLRTIRSGASLQQLAKQVVVLLAPMTILLLVQGLLVVNYTKTSVIFSPFGVWSLYSPHPVFSALLSLGFPLAVLILFRNYLFRESGLPFAWLVFAVALLQFMLLAEDGARFSHGNFLWGAYMALYTLFLMSSDVLLRQPMSSRTLLAFGFLGLHFASGLYFYWRIVGGLGYM